ncbi:hypothetical protein BHL53_27020 [Bacillus cereus]|uniref:ADP-ribosyltransferase n=1 Tax=Bacillus cereus TaxID=1396 RepID=UPI000995B5FC|nr:ADP-ribosyltransferase [Bacillus cereus]OPA21270.1 hypothetical protein BHL53_27020 [Bacillus cereus]
MENELIFTIDLPDQLHQSDFGYDKDSAKEWAKSHKERLNNDLTPNEKNAVQILDIPREINGHIYDINKVLKDTGGNVSRLPIADEKGEIDETLLDRIDKYRTLDKELGNAFKKTSTKIPNRMTVYNHIDPEDLGISYKEVWDGNYNINSSKAEELIENIYEYGLDSSYMSVSASYNRNTENLILLKLDLPKGTSVIPVGDGNSDTLHLSKDLGFMITKEMSVIVLNGRDILSIDATYISKEEIENEVSPIMKSMENTVNNLWNATLDIPANTNIFEFRFAGTFTSGKINWAQKAIEDCVLNKTSSLSVKKDILLDITNYILENEGKIIFTDISLGYCPEMQLILEDKLNEEGINYFNSATGLTNVNDRYIAINNSKPVDYSRTRKTLVHEMGHIRDRQLGERIYGEKIMLSSKNDNKNGFLHDLVKTEYDKLQGQFFDYAKSHIKEYIPEIFAFMHSDYIPDPSLVASDVRGKPLHEIVRIKVPNTVKWIEDFFIN